VAYLLSHAERQLGGWLAAQLAEEGCSVAEWRVLSFLADGHGHPMSEIADFAMLPAPTLTKLVDRMVAGNLLYRRPDDKDRRRVIAYLSERGLSLYEQLARVVYRSQADLLAALGDEGELSRLLSRLSAVLAGPVRPGTAMLVGPRWPGFTPGT
jgi:DNA-binding MarR family transcriptional regulator